MRESAGRSSENVGASSAAQPAAAPGKQSLAAREGETEEAAEPAVPTLTLGRGGGVTHGNGGNNAAAAQQGRPAAPNAGAGGAASSIRIQATQMAGVSADRRRVGVGEDVLFSAAGHGGTWTASRQISGETYPGTTRSSFSWRAPDTAGAVTIRYAPTSGEAQTVEMQVVAPDRVNFTNPVQQPAARAGAKMVNSVSLGPSDVFFGNLLWKEQGGGTAAAPQSPQGYFDRYRRMGGDLVHHPETNWIPVDANLNDTAGVEGLPPLENGSWDEGTFHWNIPNLYQVSGQQAEHRFAMVQQSFHITQHGAVTVSKGGQSVTAANGPRASAAADDAAGAQRLQEILDGEGLELLIFRMRDAVDQPTRQAIRSAINRRSATIRVTVKCTNSYSWVTEDAVSVTINSHAPSPASFTLDTNEEQAVTIPFFDAFDLDQLVSRPERIRARIGIHAESAFLSKEIATPFAERTDYETVEGSADRYQVKYELVNGGGRSGAAAPTGGGGGGTGGGH